jgi:nicotinamidase-related amidase
MTTNTALLIIDMQLGLLEPAHQSREILEHISTLVEQARASGTPILYVQHDGPKGHGLEVGSSAWNIHPAIAPQEGDLIVHKRASDSFYDTSLQCELDKRGIANLVVVGGQTEYCVDTTVRRATTLGYNVTLVGDAHTTEDYDEAVLSAAQRIAYHNEVLNGFRTDTCTIHVKPTSEIRF